MVVGVPASGKTSLARGISAALRDSAYLSKDLIQSAFTETERVDGDTYSRIQGPTYKILVDFSDVQISTGKTPVIDAPFSVNAWRKDAYSDWIASFKAVALKHSTRLAVIRCMAPGNKELKKRIQNRHYPWDEWKLAHWEEFLKREPPDFDISHSDVLNLVTDRPAPVLVTEVLKDFIKANEPDMTYRGAPDSRKPEYRRDECP